MFVKPAEGRSVRDPHTKRHIPAEGAEVPATAYWLRRVRAGDVVEVTKPRAAAPAKAAATKPTATSSKE